MKFKFSFLAAILTAIIVMVIGCEKATNPDTIPPQISITSPIDGAIVKDNVTIKTVVADNRGIKQVEFFIDGDLLTTVTEEPFQTDWNTKESTNGAHILQCKAIDRSGNETLSESIHVTVANALFTANFTNDWLCPECGDGILFISDIDGNVLGEATWTGNASFEIEAPPGMTSFPEKISVTTVTSNEYGDVYLTTDLNIPGGSSWTWKGYPSPDYNNPYQVELDFQNIPDHAGYVISSLWYSHGSSFGSVYSPYTFNFYESPIDIYIKLNTTYAGVKYLWLNNVTSGNYYVDLSNLNPTSSTTIDLQGASVGFGKYLYGYPNPGSHYTGRYILDYGYSNSTVTSVTFHYPPSNFTDYRTSLFFYDTDETYDFWYQSTYGDIPNSFTKIDADFDFVSVSPDNFQIQTAGTFDQIQSGWSIPESDYYVSWYVYGPSDLPQYSLPILSDTVTQNYPYIDRESFELYYSDLIDHSQLSSYEDILNILFNSPDYFYNVVNDFRSRVKYYESTRVLQRKGYFDNESKREDEYEISVIR